jgi:hypothetical protein
VIDGIAFGVRRRAVIANPQRRRGMRQALHGQRSRLSCHMSLPEALLDILRK